MGCCLYWRKQGFGENPKSVKVKCESDVSFSNLTLSQRGQYLVVVEEIMGESISKGSVDLG